MLANASKHGMKGLLIRTPSAPSAPENRETGLSSRLVNGEKASITDFPWQVSIGIIYKGKYISFCGGTQVSDYWLVTAGHCVHPEAPQLKSPENYVIISNKDNIDDAHPDHITRAKKIVLHNSTLIGTIRLMDLALFKTKDKLQGKAVQLPKPGQSFVGQMATITGFGGASRVGRSSEQLYKIQEKVTEDCSLVKRYYNNKTQICMQPMNKKRVCGGDSGGPMVIRSVLVGAVSYGSSKCNNFKIPDVGARITYFLDFIKKTIQT